MQCFCTINTNTNIFICLQYWMNEKSVKWILQKKQITNDQFIFEIILITNKYSNSANLSKTLKNYIMTFNNDTMINNKCNIYNIKTYYINSDTVFLKYLLNFIDINNLKNLTNTFESETLKIYKYSQKNIIEQLKNTFLEKNQTKNKNKDVHNTNNTNNTNLKEIFNCKDQNKKKDDLKCNYCKKDFSKLSNVKRHEKNCKQNLNNNNLLIKIQSLETELKLREELEKKNEHIIKLLEKEKEIEYINITNTSNNLNVIVNNNFTNSKKDKLNLFFENTIDIDTFIDKYQNDPRYKLTEEETKCLLEITEANGYISFANGVFYFLKNKYKLQLEDLTKTKLDNNDMFVLPFVNGDGNCRNHYEKKPEEWAIISSTDKIKKIISISKDQIYNHHNKPIFICGRDTVSTVNTLLRNSDYKSVISDTDTNMIKKIK